MSRLVRARPKAFEHLPEWAKCCDRALTEIQSFSEFTIDLARIYEPNYATCGYCGTPVNTGPYVPMEDGRAMPIALLDLDEGPLATKP